MQNIGQLFDPNASSSATINNILGVAHFTIKIRRDHILEDSLDALVKEGISSDINQKPLRVIFVNEPAIDEGGVKKEFFQLLFKELFDPIISDRHNGSAGFSCGERPPRGHGLGRREWSSALVRACVARRRRLDAEVRARCEAADQPEH